jgi:hypothetical protein
MVAAMPSLNGQLNYKQNMQTQDKNKCSDFSHAMQCYLTYVHWSLIDDISKNYPSGLKSG